MPSLSVHKNNQPPTTNLLPPNQSLPLRTLFRAAIKSSPPPTVNRAVHHPHTYLTNQPTPAFPLCPNPRQITNPRRPTSKRFFPSKLPLEPIQVHLAASTLNHTPRPDRRRCDPIFNYAFVILKTEILPFTNRYSRSHATPQSPVHPSFAIKSQRKERT